MACLTVFLPFQLYRGQLDQPWSLIGPVNACVAAIICMQSSLEDSWKQGFIRLRGTAIGGIVGLGTIFLYILLPYPLALIVLLGLAIILIIWFCNLIHKPRACGIGCIVCCIVVLTQSDSGLERYLAALARMVETAAGILISLGINRLLPGPRPTEEEDPASEPDPTAPAHPADPVKRP
jgi:uncharacterized membrane protein YgaE (UPF0421/DUF939 family)